MSIIYGQPDLMCSLKGIFTTKLVQKGQKRRLHIKTSMESNRNVEKNKTGVPLRGSERHALPNRTSEM